MKLNRLYTYICIFVLCTVMGAVANPSFAQDADMGFERFQKELNDLEARIERHMKTASEAAFWEEDITEQSPTFISENKTPQVVAPIAYSPPTEDNFAPYAYPKGDIIEDATSRTKVSGNYRMAFGVGDHRNFSFNDSSMDLQDRDFHYLFGERRENTFDPAIYSQYTVDIESKLTENVEFYTQLGADPWSYVATSAEVVVPNENGSDEFRFRQKYWGANNSTQPQSIRSNDKNIIGIPEMEADNDNSQAFTVKGLTDFGTQYFVPKLDLDFEFRPARKMWFDINGDIWHARIFPLADQNQVMTTDDPLGLSNTKDIWQHSPWLNEWKPIQTFSDNSIRRGYYDDEEAFASRNSSGQYLTLLRGAALEADFGRTYLGGMIASKFGLWDRYQDMNNIPGVIRIKHQMTPQWMVGSVYTYRVGLIDREPDSYNQVLAFDSSYQINENESIYGEIAGSRHELDRLSDFSLQGETDVRTDFEGQAFRAGFKGKRGQEKKNLVTYHGDFAWMDREFLPTLSTYTALRDDESWGNYPSFQKPPPGVLPFKIGTGLDRGRYVARFHTEWDAPSLGVFNLMDVRHVRDTNSNGFIENVFRDELTYQINSHWKVLGFTRWHMLPNTDDNVEPFLGSFIFPTDDDPSYEKQILENVLIESGQNPSRKTFGMGLEFTPRPAWTFSGTYIRSNDIPDFPRGLLNDVFLNANIQDPENPEQLLDVEQPFLYSQYVFGLPPYNYFSIIKENIIYRPNRDLQFIFHAAQNSYSLWGPNDENLNHQGLSMDWQINDRTALFMDYTHSVMGDVPRLINTIDEGIPELNFESHNNIYATMTYKINADSMLQMEYGVFGKSFYRGSDAIPATAFAVTTFSLPTLDTEHLFRMSLKGDF